MAPAPPDHFGPYKVLGSLGAGGMGEVWKARDTRLDRIVAVKASKAAFDDRFEREARAVAALNHPNIVALYDVGRDAGVSYLVTELVDGDSLRTLLARDPLPLRRTLELAAQIAAGLAAAHQIGIVHRDLKPENIMVTREGRAKILDFGLAKHDHPPSDDTQTHSGPLTHEGSVMGTVGYMSPEQARGRAADHRSDIFSFGAVLYEMLAGHRAFEAPSNPETLTAILKHDPADLPPHLPAAVRNCVLHCLEKEPHNRFQSAQDLAFALQALTAPSSPSGPHTPLPARSAFRLWPALTAAATLAALASASLWQLARNAPSPTEHLRFLSFLADADAEVAPAWAPDGRSIAYWRLRPAGRALYLKSFDSPEPVELWLDAGRFAGPQIAPLFWAPDSSRLFFPAGRAVYAIGAAGGTPQRILDNVETAILSPDGSQLLLANRTDQGYRLAVSAPPGAPPQPLPYNLSSLGTSQLQLLAFAPNQQNVALRARSELWILPYPAGQPRHLENLDQLGSVSWFPDSRHLLVTGSWRGAVSRLLALDTASTELLALDQGTQGVGSAHLAPDGSRAIAAVGIPVRDIVEIAADGKLLGERLASSLPESAPAWSPAGDRFAYVVALGEGSQIRLTEAGMDQSVILHSGLRGNPQPQFSADGRRVAYAEPRQIWIVPASGGRPVGLLPKDYAHAVLALAWSPDGNWLAFVEGFNGRPRLRKISTAGGAPPIDIKATVARPLLSWSADGKWLAYSGPDGLHVLSPDGANGKLLSPKPPLALQFGRPGNLLYSLTRADEDRHLLTSLDPDSGRELRAVPMQIDPKTTPRAFSPSPDGSRFLLEVFRPNSDLWLIEGIPQPAAGLARLWTRWAPPAASRMAGEGNSGY
ncbi:MAG: protein kinase [Acidobacteriaceae bacterium]|nr:protein kinase [Acidobacteriaceae bacterium]